MVPGKSLPPPVDPALIGTLLTFLSLPQPTSIARLEVNAAFHAIYLIHYAAPPPELQDLRTAGASDGAASLVLRIAGPHVPYLKTSNEVAVMTWLRRRTSIPVPRVVRYDQTVNNVLGREFTLVERMPGRSVDSVYARLDDAAKRKLVTQLTDMLLELHAHAFHHVGGLQLVGDDIRPGPLLQDTCWFLPGREADFGSDESVETLHALGPYSSHADYVKGYVAALVHAISVHEPLRWLRDLLPRLRALVVVALPRLRLDTAMVLAHKDLHFGNVMASPDGDVTAILDWEFAAVVPVTRWDPVHAFLWNCRYTQEGHDEKYRMRAVFERELERRGVPKWWEAPHDDIGAVWDLVSHLRAVVELCPRGERLDECRLWRQKAEQALAKLGV